jgi:hypothetical protein
MWEKLKNSVAAFFSNPLKFLSDPQGVVIEYQVQQLANQGMTVAQIDQVLEQNNFVKGSTVNDILVGIKDVATFTVKNLPTMLVIALLLVVGWYVLMFRKAVE